MSLELYKSVDEVGRIGTDHGFALIGVKDPIQWYKDNSDKVTKGLERLLEETRAIITRNTQSDTTSNAQQRCITYCNHHEPDCFSHMLQTMLKQNNLEPKNIMTRYSSHKPSINLSPEFIEPLSLEAQETLCTYLVDIVMHPHSIFADTLVISEEQCLNEALFIPFALQNKDRTILCYKLLKEIVLLQLHPQPSIGLFDKIDNIYKAYEKIAWLKKYVVAENQ